MQSTSPQTLLVSIKAPGKQVPPQPHAAFAAAVKTGIAVARIRGRARQTLHQSNVCRIERVCHHAISYSQKPEGARRLLSEDVTCGRRRNPLAREHDNPFRTFRGKSGESAAVAPGQSLPAGNPSRCPGAFGTREPPAFEVCRIYRIYCPRKTPAVDQHVELLMKSERKRCPASYLDVR